MKYTISLLVNNENTILTRLTSLFSRRGYILESFAIGPAESKDLCRLTLVVPGTKRSINQLMKQLYKLVGIIRVEDVTFVPCVERELLIAKLNATKKTRPEILEIANIFHAKVVDFTLESVILEVTGDPGKIVVVEKALNKFGIIELARTGKIALIRESYINTEILKYMK